MPFLPKYKVSFKVNLVCGYVGVSQSACSRVSAQKLALKLKVAHTDDNRAATFCSSDVLWVRFIPTMSWGTSLLSGDHPLSDHGSEQRREKEA